MFTVYLMIFGDCDNNFVFINALQYKTYAYYFFLFLGYKLKNQKKTKKNKNKTKKTQKNKKPTFDFEKILVFCAPDVHCVFMFQEDTYV